MKGTGTKKEQLRTFGNYCFTPVEEIVKFLYAWNKIENIKKFKLILDPCAGGLKKSAKRIKMRSKYRMPGEPMSYPEALVQFGFKKNQIITNDIRKDSPAQYHLDYLKMEINPKPDLIITNPPFFWIIEIVQKALQDVKSGGFVVMLAPSGGIFSTSKKRYLFLQEYIPQKMFLHHTRMSFWPDGGIDFNTYMHVIWKEDKIKRNYSQYRII